MNVNPTSELHLREPLPAELPRVAHLFRNARLRRTARLLVAVRSRPVERFVAAAAWWLEGAEGRVQLACLPGVDRGEVGPHLLDAVVARARELGWISLQYSDLLRDEDEWVPVLRDRGFERLRSERSFQVSYAEAWNRVMALHRKHQARIPAEWRTQPVREVGPEAVLGFIAPHRLMPPTELCEYWRPDAAGGFEPEWSCVLFSGQRPFGTFLLRRLGETLYIDVLVVQEPNPLLRSLGELCLFFHGISRLAPDGPIRWLAFRSGAIEHRQTANLALRMGGREMSLRHVYGKKLR